MVYRKVMVVSSLEIEDCKLTQLQKGFSAFTRYEIFYPKGRSFKN